jgi:hypothetical protein
MSGAEERAAHSWSGWPGAWCLHCGAGDPYEEALADSRIDFDEATGNPVFPDDLLAEIRPKMICPEPGSNRHNPYINAAIQRGEHREEGR